MKPPNPPARPGCGPPHPLVCRDPCFELERHAGADPDFETHLRWWRVEHLEHDWSFRARVLRAAGLLR